MGAELKTDRPGPRIVTAAGARATEDRVLAEIEALLPSSSGDTELLGTPVVVVVLLLIAPVVVRLP